MLRYKYKLNGGNHAGNKAGAPHRGALQGVIEGADRTDPFIGAYVGFQENPCGRPAAGGSRGIQESWGMVVQKTESDIETRFGAVGARRASEGIRLHQVVWALLLSRDHLWHFLRQYSFADNVVALYGELELQGLLTQLFDRAMYYAVLGYEQAASAGPKQPGRDLANLIRLVAAQDSNNPSELDD